MSTALGALAIASNHVSTTKSSKELCSQGTSFSADMFVKTCQENSTFQYFPRKWSCADDSFPMNTSQASIPGHYSQTDDASSLAKVITTSLEK